MTISQDLLEDVVARLKATGAAWYPKPANVRRDHRVPVDESKVPALYVVDGEERIVGRRKNGCDVDVEQRFRVCIYVRNDDGFAAADPIKAEVYARLENVGQSPVYPWQARIEPGDIRPQQEIADNDSLAVELEFVFKYGRPQWSL